MRLSQLLLALTATVMISACSQDPYSMVLNENPVAQLTQEQDTIHKLTPEEQELLSAYVKEMAAQNNTKALTGKTITVALTDAKAWLQAKEDAKIEAQTEAKNAADQAKAEQEAIAKQLAEYVNVTVLNKKLLPSNLVLNRINETLLYTLEVENKMDKLIVQIEGNLVATDKDGKEIGVLPVVIDKKLKEGSKTSVPTNPGWEINTPDNAAATELAKYELKDITLTFVPTSISYQGIETIGTPRTPPAKPKTSASPAMSAENTVAPSADKSSTNAPNTTAAPKAEAPKAAQ